MGNPHRDRPLRSRQPKAKVEEDQERLVKTRETFPAPAGAKEFKEGYRECVELYALHKPNRRGVMRILDEHCILLEEACMRAMTRENLARYEGYKQALKELRKRGVIKKR